jgi:hypothetical protein
MAEVFLTKSSSEWEVLFGAIGVPAAAQQTTDEWLHSEHTKDAGLAVVLKDPKWGSMLQMGPVAWFDHGNILTSVFAFILLLKQFTPLTFTPLFVPLIPYTLHYLSYISTPLVSNLFHHCVYTYCVRKFNAFSFRTGTNARTHTHTNTHKHTHIHHTHTEPAPVLDALHPRSLLPIEEAEAAWSDANTPEERSAFITVFCIAFLTVFL